MRFPFVALGMTAFLSLLLVGQSIAQSLCTSIVQEAIAATAANCGNLERNRACYGNFLVNASFVIDVPPDFFTEPADRADLLDIERLATTAFDVETEQWGIALMNLQANLPNTLPGQGVLFLLLGDTEVENALDPATLFDPERGLAVTINANADVRSGPGLNFNVIAGVEAGQTIIVDGLDSTEMWLRTVVNNQIGWANRAVLTPEDNAAVDDLPRLTSELRSAMQSFSLRTGIGPTLCEEAPDGLLIQGRDDVTVDLTINGVNVELVPDAPDPSAVAGVGITPTPDADAPTPPDGVPHMGLPPGGLPPTIILTTDGDGIEIIVISGSVRLLDDLFQPTGITIQAGQGAQACLDADGSVSCPFSQPQAADLTSLCTLQALPPTLLNAPIRIAGCGTASTSANPTPATGGGGSPSVERSDDDRPDEAPAATPEVDCAGFVVPPQTIIAANFTLDWPDVPGATAYDVAIFDHTGYLLQTIRTADSALATNGGIFPSVGYVDVRVYRDGAYICFARLNFVREGDPNPPTADIFILSCERDGMVWTVRYGWGGLGDGGHFTITITSGAQSASADGSGDSGRGTITLTTMGTPGQLFVVIQRDNGDISTRVCPPG